MRTESLAEGAVWDLGKRPRLKLYGACSPGAWRLRASGCQGLSSRGVAPRC